MMVLGIDCGRTGAVALYDPRTHRLDVHDLPHLPSPAGLPAVDPHELRDVLALAEPGALALVEIVRPFRTDARPSLFAFAEGFATVKCCLALCGVAYRLVEPTAWRRHHRLVSRKGMTHADRKRQSLAEARRRFPGHAATTFARAKDDGRAEAALIALYAAETAREGAGHG
jgi:hypothetical protein